jgi:hypothetical protein
MTTLNSIYFFWIIISNTFATTISTFNTLRNRIKGSRRKCIIVDWFWVIGGASDVVNSSIVSISGVGNSSITDVGPVDVGPVDESDNCF